MSAFLVNGVVLDTSNAGFEERLAEAYAGRRRPRCLCNGARPEMYVARLGDGHVAKRMPFTGSLHAPGCPSYEPPPEISGLGPLSNAIQEDPGSGTTLLRLGFRMSRREAHPVAVSIDDGDGSVAASDARLTMRGLLHYLWTDAGLARWHPGFAGRRTWAIVRKHLLDAALGKFVGGRALADWLYLPEVFSVAEREPINSRRAARWAAVQPRAFALLIGELKEVSPARFGYKAIVKHMPDIAFSVEEALFRRIEVRFESELTLWATSEHVHMVMIATFALDDAGTPRIEELSLMPVTSQWVPFRDRFELHLIAQLVRDDRRFTKTLRYDSKGDRAASAAVLLDTTPPCALHVIRRDADKDEAMPCYSEIDRIDCWHWEIARGAMPNLPEPTGSPA
ncbi:MAG: DUF1173 family protein [Casimicrobiaceae bacterium]